MVDIDPLRTMVKKFWRSVQPFPRYKQSKFMLSSEKRPPIPRICLKFLGTVLPHFWKFLSESLKFLRTVLPHFWKFYLKLKPCRIPRSCVWNTIRTCVNSRSDWFFSSFVKVFLVKRYWISLVEISVLNSVLKLWDVISQERLYGSSNFFHHRSQWVKIY